MIKVISWNQEDNAEPAYIYRLDQPGEGDRFFRDLLANAETDGREKFEVVEISPEQFAEAEKSGAELA